MAIHPTLRPDPSSPARLTPQQTLSISAWTEEATASLQDLTIAASGSDSNAPEEPAAAIRGTSVSLAIPLDDPVYPRHDTLTSRVKIVKDRGEGETRALPSTYRRREPIRRDSLKRREALLKGKEGSRRRQRWENDRLLSNPWAQPPSASDWLIQPTYRRHNPVPYYLASLWDAHYAHKDHRKGSKPTGAKQNKDEKHQVAKELRKKLKHARAARGLLQDLEEDIRHFVQKWNEKQSISREGNLEDAPTSSDSGDSEDEIVFVGRSGQMHDSPERRRRLAEINQEMNSRQERNGEKMVFESLANDRGAVFGRWLVYSIATYYGLHTWSVTVGDPARREAYVGFNPPGRREGQISFPSGSAINCRDAVKMKAGDPLPTPLWIQL